MSIGKQDSVNGCGKFDSILFIPKARLKTHIPLSILTLKNPIRFELLQMFTKLNEIKGLRKI